MSSAALFADAGRTSETVRAVGMPDQECMIGMLAVRSRGSRSRGAGSDICLLRAGPPSVLASGIGLFAPCVVPLLNVVSGA